MSELNESRLTEMLHFTLQAFELASTAARQSSERSETVDLTNISFQAIHTAIAINSELHKLAPTSTTPDGPRPGG